MTGAKRNAPKQQDRNQRPEKRPPLTHFLCLPLVNPTSLSQLESSVASFKANYRPVPVTDLSATSTRQDARAIIPEGAIRPLGTLHLTIGVMSLPTVNQLADALRFFHSLDLAGLMREAGRVATELRERRKSHNSSISATDDPRHIRSRTSTAEASRDLGPMHVTLQSLHSLPRAKAATVLHAFPEDPTGRLYPFCLMLRDKFIEAGFIQNENKDNQAHDQKFAQDDRPQSESKLAPQALDPYTVALNRVPKPRPLLLHATIVNTIYVRRQPKAKPDVGHSNRAKNKPSRLEIDARDILARYQNYYFDEARTIPRQAPPSRSEAMEGTQNEDNRGASQPTKVSPQYPFVWAKDIPIDTVCICEMGARKLPLDSENANLNKRLGEKYTVVAQRSLSASHRR
ncbi:hypothetical protein N7523_002883 [Penicillium sp. IBT 18751x]|nr:hypothetical protein N7523_002883 [Penicillium sp. IBT 18751x]